MLDNLIATGHTLVQDLLQNLYAHLEGMPSSFGKEDLAGPYLLKRTFELPFRLGI